MGEREDFLAEVGAMFPEMADALRRGDDEQFLLLFCGAARDKIAELKAALQSAQAGQARAEKALEEIRDNHVRGAVTGSLSPNCFRCGVTWPCPTNRMATKALLAALSAPPETRGSK